MPDPIESYKLGEIQVTVKPDERPNKLTISCFDGEFKSEFTVSEYEFKNYRRLMNQRISQTFAEGRKAD
ncbi:MAG: hypothetical protein RLN90_06415 [Balneolaceae bacterium]